MTNETQEILCAMALKSEIKKLIETLYKEQDSDISNHVCVNRTDDKISKAIAISHLINGL